MIKELDVLESPAACCTPLGAIGMSEEDAETTAEVFRALGDPNRVRIVNQLANAPGPVCVCDLTAGMELAQPTVSFHLKKLVSAGLLEREQRGVWAFYSIHCEALKRLATIFTMEEATV